MEFIVIGLVTAINFIIIIKKVKLKRYEDAVLDTAIFVVLAALFAGSYAGMVVAMIASMTVSIYLLANPPTTFRSLLHNIKQSDEFKQRMSELRPHNPDAKKGPIDL